MVWRCILGKCKVTAESRRLLTVMSVTGPGTRLLCHSEERVRDIGQKAVQVKHVGLHRRSLGFRVHLIGPLLQLCLADLTLECIKRSLKPSNQLWATHKVTKKKSNSTWTSASVALIILNLTTVASFTMYEYIQVYNNLLYQLRSWLSSSSTDTLAHLPNAPLFSPSLKKHSQKRKLPPQSSPDHLVFTLHF